MRPVFPEDLPHVNSFEELQQSDVGIWPCVEPENFTRTPYLSLGQASVDFILDEAYAKDDVFQGNGWAVVHVKNACIHGDMIYTPHDGKVFALVPWWRFGSLLYHFHDRSNETVVSQRLARAIAERPKRELITIDEPCTLMCHGPHGHWLYEGLLPLSIWEKIGFKPTLLSNNACPSYRKGFMNLSGYPEEKQIFINRETHDAFCKDLWLAFPWRNRPSRLTPLLHGWTQDRIHCYDQGFSWWLNTSSVTMDAMCALGAKAPTNLARGDKIFVRREGTALHRVCVNEDEAAKIAEKHGFVSVNPSLLGGEEEAAIFHHAKIICGSSGGGIHNVIFSKSGARVICLGAEDDFSWPLPSICLVKQLDLTVVRSTQFSSMEPFGSGSLSLFAIDLIAFDDLLSKLS
jgi:hypothetical protein